MSVLVNLRNLERKPEHLTGDLTAEQLELEGIDEIVRMPSTLTYDLNVEQMEQALYVHGTLHVDFECDCARCLKTFIHEVTLEDWACHVPLEGDDKAEIKDDCVDLTPYLREDILLEFPRHPLCEPDCSGLAKLPSSAKLSGNLAKSDSPSAWSALNKLKFES